MMRHHSFPMRVIAHAVAVTLTATPLGNVAFAQTVQNTTWQYQYDAQGNPTQITDPLNHITNQEFDAHHRIKIQRQPAPVTGGTRPIVNLTYDGLDQTATVTDPRNLTTTYTTDGLGNTTRITSPDTGITTQTFDAAGNLKTRLDARGKTTTYTYDGLNRPTLISYASGTPTTFEYDNGLYAKGHLTKITDESGQTVYAYNQRGRLLSKVQTVGSGTGAKTFTVNYTIGTTGTANGMLSAITYPSGNRINLTYNAAGQINNLTLNPANENGSTNTSTTINLLTNIGYAPFGPARSWTWGNSTPTAPNTYTRSIDLDGRISSYPLGNSINDGTQRTLSYDAASRILTTTHTGTGTGGNAPANFNQGFGYDNLDRLTSFTGSSTSQGFQYDTNGNRTSFTIGATTYANTIAATANKLMATTGPAPARVNSHDAIGNLTTDGSTGYSYSDRGRMQSAIIGSNTVSYLYNGLDQRVKKSGPTSLVSTGSQYYVHDEQGRLLGEYDATGKPVQETVYLGDTPVAVLTPATIPTTPPAATVDNTDANTTIAGSWTTSTSSPGYYGSNYHTHAPGSGTDGFTWNLNLPATGTYKIYARWTAYTNRATDAPYTITHNAGTSTTTVNQQANNNTWVLLGTYNFNAGSGSVKLGTSNTGYCIADAVQAVPAPSAVIVDNAETANTAITGAWTVSTSSPGYFGANYHTHAPSSGADSFTWKINLAAAGTYEIYARWTAYTNRATDAPYTITHNAGTSTVTMNQQGGNNTWMWLGKYQFNAGIAQIKLGTTPTGYSIADAVQAVPAGDATMQVHYVYADHVNTPRVITRAIDNKMVWRWDGTDPFGLLPPNENPAGLGPFIYNPRFPGQLWDKETNLFYNGWRYYDPQLGIYRQSDPIGNVLYRNMAVKNLAAQGLVKREIAEQLYSERPVYNQSYAYVGSNPISFVDPYGLSKFDKMYGLPKEFWNWYHRRVKKPGDPDLAKEEAQELCDEWKQAGKPGPDNKKHERGSADPDLLEWLIPWWLTPSELGCSDLNCK